ncbi:MULTISPECIES: GNAT family N-acetyltransferase [Pontibacillus]|uniref:N-acetyltransferase n=1 Tax=Pontibacillus chungwhensis TaxID=265426 RepID=A0ABY8USW0_9BACI|nr:MULTISPECIES: N-acetyltransferase [Pontibacillus]MCD5323375.1 GNAT family N-acetyltransferase [Pontibacillus sp. HN14]WIF96756.1 N-acetyltransferase [Pontibacillus chungwhensis]
MKTVIDRPYHLREVAHFISELNKDPATHIGYAGDEIEEIYDTLTSDFSDLDPVSSFSVCYESGHIVGAMGVDANLDDGSGEVWGPFVRQEADDELAETLWGDLLAKLPSSITSFSFMIHKQNKEAKTFLSRVGARKQHHHLVLQTTLAQQQDEETIASLSSYTPSDFELFKALHDTIFPHTYFSAQTIVNRLNEHHKLLFVKNGSGNLKGYVYIEANPDHREGSIEYIGVSEAYRRKGVGHQLLTAVLEHLFSYKEIQEISICVSKENEGAIALYKRAGFKEISELENYELEVGREDG